MTRLMAGARNLPEKGPVISLAGVVFPDSRRAGKKTAASARERLTLWREFLGSIAGTPATPTILRALTMCVKGVMALIPPARIFGISSGKTDPSSGCTGSHSRMPLCFRP